MGIIAKSSGQSYEMIPQGLHTAICYSVIDLGTHKFEYQGKVTEIRRVLITWEIPDERIMVEKEGGDINMPRAISKEYTLSLHENSNLRKDLETWRSKQFTPEELEGFDLTKLLGKPCQIQVLHEKKDSGKMVQKVTSIVQAPKGYKAEPENTLVYYSFDDDMIIPENLPEWIVKKIKEAKEYIEPVDQSIPGIEDIQGEMPF